MIKRKRNGRREKESEGERESRIPGDATEIKKVLAYMRLCTNTRSTQIDLCFLAV